MLDALLDSGGSQRAACDVILDPNRDAFGRQKDGVPNRPVANELVTQSGEKIQVRWYRTHGEQFHTKMALIRRGDRFIASLGSANLTRRNIGNYNLEANIALEDGVESPLAIEMMGYFDRCGTTTVRRERSTRRRSGRIGMRTAGGTGGIG